MTSGHDSCGLLMLKASQLQSIAQRVHERLPCVLAVYVFGSIAKGNANKNSDLDLAVLGGDCFQVMDVWQLAQDLVIDAGMDVDLIDLRAASAVMRIQVIAEGQRLMCSDEDVCAVFEDFVFSDYARLNEERADILNDIQKRGTIYG